MANLSVLQVQNWLALYAATGVCCAFAVFLSIVTTVVELHRERAWEQVRSFKAVAVFVPKTWWRWQKLYLLSTPVTLAIIGFFAATLHWG